MHTFEVLPASGANAVAAQFGGLVPAFQSYVEREIDLAHLQQEIAFVGIGAQYLPLDDLSLHPLKALRLMGCSNVAALASATHYECGFTGTVRHCFLPLGIVTSLQGLNKYYEAFDQHGAEYHSSVLHVIPAANRFQARVFQVPGVADNSLVDEGPYNYERGLTRVERLFLGSGATVAHLTARMDLPQLGAVALRLSNADLLIGVAYRQ